MRPAALLSANVRILFRRRVTSSVLIGVWLPITASLSSILPRVVRLSAGLCRRQLQLLKDVSATIDLMR